MSFIKIRNIAGRIILTCPESVIKKYKNEKFISMLLKEILSDIKLFNHTYTTFENNDYLSIDIIPRRESDTTWELMLKPSDILNCPIENLNEIQAGRLLELKKIIIKEQKDIKTPKSITDKFVLDTMALFLSDDFSIK